MQDGGKVVRTHAMNMCGRSGGAAPLIPKLHKLELSAHPYRPFPLPPEYMLSVCNEKERCS